MDTDKPSGRTAPGALHKHSRQIALSVVASQLVVAGGLALVLAMVFGGRAAYSALVGASIGILPTYYLAIRIFKQPASGSPEQALRSIYLGEGIKVIFTVALFVIAMLMLDVNLPIVMASYMATVLVNWVAMYRADLGESPRPGA